MYQQGNTAIVERVDSVCVSLNNAQYKPTAYAGSSIVSRQSRFGKQECANTLKPMLIQAALTKIIQVTLNKHSLDLTKEQVYAVTVVEMDRNKTFISIFIVRVYKADLCLQLSIFQTDSKQTQTHCERASDVKKTRHLFTPQCK
jgi:hypothetical protein